MNPQHVLLITILIAIAFVLLFTVGRKSVRAPTRLRLRNDPDQIENKGGNEVKDIAVMFNYNGHSWNAYEVLGVSKANSLGEIKASFEKALARSDVKSHEFLKTALEAILIDMKDRGYKP